MKSVLISIKPKYCELIASGKKTVEIRKTRPKLEMPFKCYIYCTSKYDKSGDGYFQGKYCGKVIGEFVCYKIDVIGKRGVNSNFDYCYLSLDKFGNDDVETEITDIKKSCISKEELNEYGTNARNLYAWHISDLMIYDKPKELSEFKKYNRTCYYSDLGFAIPKCSDCRYCNLKRPFQSWGYVEGYNE